MPFPREHSPRKMPAQLRNSCDVVVYTLEGDYCEAFLGLFINTTLTNYPNMIYFSLQLTPQRKTCQIWFQRWRWWRSSGGTRTSLICWEPVHRTVRLDRQGPVTALPWPAQANIHTLVPQTTVLLWTLLWRMCRTAWINDSDTSFRARNLNRPQLLLFLSIHHRQKKKRKEN